MDAPIPRKRAAVEAGVVAREAEAEEAADDSSSDYDDDLPLARAGTKRAPAARRKATLRRRGRIRCEGQGA